MSATADSWTRQPFEDGVPIPYRAQFDGWQFERIRQGLIPRAMEDKWFVYCEASILYLHRSWTGLPVYKVVFRESANGAEVVDALWSKSLAEEADADPTYQAALLDFLISNLILGQSKPFPQPGTRHGAPRGLFQHHVAGTGYREAEAPTEKEE